MLGVPEYGDRYLGYTKRGNFLSSSLFIVHGLINEDYKMESVKLN
jgi:hypothetical protein